MLVAQIFPAGSYNAKVIDLADHADDLFKWPSDAMAELNQAVAESDVAIFASPTYKATYTGLLKAFLDRYSVNGLKNVVALALMTGADYNHSMAPTVHLIPLLLELGAAVPVRGLYFNTAKMDQVDGIVAGFAAEATDAFKALAPVVLTSGGSAVGGKDSRQV